MLSCNLNTMRILNVTEQAYRSFKSPLRGWECSSGSKGFSNSLLSVASYAGSIEGLFFNSFPAFLRKEGAKLNSRFIPDSGHCIFGRLESYRRFLFSTADFFDELSAALLPVGKIECKILNFAQCFNREFREYFPDVVDFFCCGIHVFSISQVIQAREQMRPKAEQQRRRVAGRTKKDNEMECNITQEQQNSSKTDNSIDINSEHYYKRHSRA